MYFGGSGWPVGMHVDLDRVRQRREVAEEAVPARDLERDQRDLPRPARRLQRPVEAADVHDEDPRRAQLDGAVDRDRVDDPAVDEVLAADLDRRQDPRHGGGGEHGVDERAGREPVLGRAPRCSPRRTGSAPAGPRSARSAAPRSASPAARRCRAGACRCARASPSRPSSEPAKTSLRSMSDHGRGQPLRPSRRVGSLATAAPLIAPDRGADDQVRDDPALEQRAQHPDLVRPELPAAAEHERDHPPTLPGVPLVIPPTRNRAARPASSGA